MNRPENKPTHMLCVSNGNNDDYDDENVIEFEKEKVIKQNNVIIMIITCQLIENVEQFFCKFTPKPLTSTKIGS